MPKTFSNPSIKPKTPTVVIEPRRRWNALDLRELWQYRDLLYILTVRDIKVRYKQTVLGVAWAIIQPLGAMLIFTVFLWKIDRARSESGVLSAFCLRRISAVDFFRQCCD